VSKSGTKPLSTARLTGFIRTPSLNANSWDKQTIPPMGLEILSTDKKPQHDNRSGFTFGGPLKKNRDVLLRKLRSAPLFRNRFRLPRIVPTDSLKAGNLIVNGQIYNLATHRPLAGPGGNLSLRPRAASESAPRLRSSGT